VVKKASAGDYGADVLKALMGGAKAHDNIIVKARGTLNPLGVGMRVSLLAHRGTMCDSSALDTGRSEGQGFLAQHPHSATPTCVASVLN
jgi:hypothetical protein